MEGFYCLAYATSMEGPDPSASLMHLLSAMAFRAAKLGTVLDLTTISNISLLQRQLGQLAHGKALTQGLSDGKAARARYVVHGVCCTALHRQGFTAWPCDVIAHCLLLQGFVVRRLFLPDYLHRCTAHMHDAYNMQNKRQNLPQNLYSVHACLLKPQGDDVDSAQGVTAPAAPPGRELLTRHGRRP